MICGTPEISMETLTRLDIVSGYASLDEDLRSLCLSVAHSAADPTFPGGLIPIVANDGTVCVYALTSSEREWRQLRPLLLSFAGPTLTSFMGLPIELRARDPVEEILRDANPTTVGILHLPSDRKAQLQGLRALVRIQDTWSRAPDLDDKPAEPTSWLLANFQDLINVGRRDAAMGVIDRLRGELRLDALNLRFLEVQLLAAFCDWAAIVAMPGIADLCAARRPPSITAVLLESFYQVELAGAFGIEDLAECKRRYEEACRPVVQQMLILPPPPGLTEGSWRMYALESIVDGDRPDIAPVLAAHVTEIGWLARHLSGESLPSDIGQAPGSLSPLDDARSALIDVDDINSLAAVSAALTKLSDLSKEDIASLRNAEPFRTLLRELAAQDSVPAALPADWVQWLERIEDPDFSNALEVARRGKDEWPISHRETDPVAVERLVRQLERVQSVPIAVDRASDALPPLVAWLRRDPEYPRATMASVYSTLLTLFALGTRRGRGIFESSGLLVSALLSIGMSDKAYRGLLGDIDELLGSGLGIDSLYWLLDVLEDTIRSPAPDAGARYEFWNTALTKIQPLRSRLSTLQRASVVRLAVDLGWPEEALAPTSSAMAVDSHPDGLSGLKIAIYTLTESASRQAEIELKKISPQVGVECSADHGGSPRLKAMAENSDIFVLTSLSASHAATDFIRHHRGDRPLLYAPGKGFTSILRVIEEYLIEHVHTPVT
jgi:hypothetical protein